MKYFSQKILQVSIMIILSMIVQIGYSQCLNCDVSKSNISAGYNNTLNSTWTNQSILGSGNTTNRNNAVAIGSNSQANWSHSYVFGSFSVTNGMHAYVIGSNSVAETTSSFAFGNYAKSMFGNAHSIGNFTTSNQVGAYVFGLGISDVYPLINNTTNSLVVGFKSQYPTLFVSETPTGNQSGRVGIGNVTDPQAKLHIRADEDEEAAIMLESFGRRSPSQRIIMTNNKDLTGWLELSVGKDDRSVFTLSNLKSERKSNMRFESQYFLFYEGAVGIGTEEPQAMLDVAGGAIVESLSIKGGYSLPTTAGNQTQFLRGDGTWAVPSGGGGGSSYWLPSGNNIYYTGGNVGIGTASTDYKLTVAGGIHAREVKVTLNAGADYVFASDYKLTPLHELENFVIANKRLPGVASETEMLEQGLDIGGFQIKLLEKIEELTLYIIQQQKEIEALKTAFSKP